MRPFTHNKPQARCWCFFSPSSSRESISRYSTEGGSFRCLDRPSGEILINCTQSNPIHRSLQSPSHLSQKGSKEEKKKKRQEMSSKPSGHPPRPPNLIGARKTTPPPRGGRSEGYKENATIPLLSTPSLNVLGKLSTKGSSKIGGKNFLLRSESGGAEGTCGLYSRGG